MGQPLITDLFGVNSTLTGTPKNEGDYTFNGYAEFKPATVGGCSGLRLFLDGIDQGSDYTFYPDAVIISTTCPDPNKYDCLNGSCIKAASGIYKSLSDCQAVCANGGACGAGKQCVDPVTFCPDGKVCIEQGEFASIEALISKIGSEVC
ncbi:MAG: hypothetical protein V7L00_17890 [Nostoc sp.]|uniref:hypothetical protein n=1 Tax=Nostoc sp. TaxID=1180 RepID=UPI002FFD1CF5